MPHNKQPERDAIAAAVKRFKKAGGKVEKLAIRVLDNRRAIIGTYSSDLYTTCETKVMRQMIKEGASVPEIAQALRRAESSVIRKLRRMRINFMPVRV